MITLKNITDKWLFIIGFSLFMIGTDVPIWDFQDFIGIAINLTVSLIGFYLMFFEKQVRKNLKKGVDKKWKGVKL